MRGPLGVLIDVSFTVVNGNHCIVWETRPLIIHDTKPTANSSNQSIVDSVSYFIQFQFQFLQIEWTWYEFAPSVFYVFFFSKRCAQNICCNRTKPLKNTIT